MWRGAVRPITFPALRWLTMATVFARLITTILGMHMAALAGRGACQCRVPTFPIRWWAGVRDEGLEWGIPPWGIQAAHHLPLARLGRGVRGDGPSRKG